MHRALSQFEVNIESARQLGVIHQAFEDKVTGVIPLDELLRAEIVLAVSALDCYVHDIVRIRMTAVLAQAGGESNAFLNWSVSLDFVKRALRSSTAADQAALFEQEVRRLHGFRTFQRAASISEALSLVGVQSLWDKVAAGVGRPASDVKRELDLVIERRNRIAHEGDIDPSAGFALKYPIDFATVQTAVAFIETVVDTIHSVVVSEASP